MITRVWSDLATFREVTFESGMNVVLADRGKDSEETESTNGLGKTTLLRIIHFCLGSDLARDRALSHPDLAGVTFGLDFEVAGERVTVSRNTSSPRRVGVTPQFIVGLPIEFERTDENRVTIDLEQWRYALSARLTPESRLPDEPMKFAPSFRELAYYFIRVGKEAFVDPQAAYRSQSGASKRLIVSFLLGLNWTAQRELHALLDAKASVQSALKALKEAADATDEQSIGDLEAERVVLENALVARQADVERFNLRSDYHDLEKRLEDVDQSLHALINENHSDRRLLAYYQESAQAAPLFDATRPVSILEDAGAVFKPEALRSLEEVAAFHARIYQNRSEFLAAEIRRLKAAIEDRDRFIDRGTENKSSLLRVLSSSGAIEALLELQRSTTDLSAQLEALKARIEERKRFDRRKDELTAEIGHARSVLKQDLEDRRAGIDEAIALFAEYTRFLYGVPGKLSVDVQDQGYRYSFSIDRQGSDGVDQMVVFCFDLMVATLRARRGAKFLSLVHDSSLFADVDPRQYGLALQLAIETSAAEGFQYICCLNAGALPSHHLGALKLDDLIRLRLTDEDDAGRLLGRRLPPTDRG